MKKGLLDRAKTTAPQEAPGTTKGEQISPELKPLMDMAVEVLYNENFDKLIKLFKSYGAEGFPQAMAIAINGVLDRVAKEAGGLPVEAAAEIGMRLFGMLLEDLVTGGVIQEPSQEDAKEAISAAISLYVQNHPEEAQDGNAIAGELNNLSKGVPGTGAPPGVQV